MIEVRDEAVHRLEEGDGNGELFADVAALNGALRAEESTCALFRRIHESNPALARQWFGYARDSLMQRHEYGLFLECIPQPQAEFDRLRREREEQIQRAAGAGDPAWQRQFADESFIRQSSQVVPALAAAGRQAESEQIRVQAAALLPVPQFNPKPPDRPRPE